MKKVNVGLIGLGTVGSKVAEFLQNNPRFALIRVAVRDLRKKRKVFLPPGLLTNKVSDVVCHPDVEVVMDASNDAPENIVERIIHKKNWAPRAAFRHTVLASKKAVALYGRELLEFSQKHGVEIGMEATVCAGIPIVRPLREGHIPEDIVAVGGILNGTTNYMLTRMREGASYDVALKDAQKLGYAEANPHEDVSGLDAAYKLLILTGLCWGEWLKLAVVRVSGIEQLRKSNLPPCQLGAHRLFALAEYIPKFGVSLVVEPVRLDKFVGALQMRLTTTLGVENLVYIKTASRELYFSGPGAGGEATAMAMISDLNHIADKINK
jgi:homoserine dehydrogenase